MKKEMFFKELIDLLELEEDQINEETVIVMDSLALLSLIAFLDENFGMKIKAENLKHIKKVNDIIDIIGAGKIT